MILVLIIFQIVFISARLAKFPKFYNINPSTAWKYFHGVATISMSALPPAVDILSPVTDSLDKATN